MKPNKKIREYLEASFIAIVLAFLLRSFVITAFYMPAESMVPNVLPGDFIFAYRLAYGIRLSSLGWQFGGRSPVRGELVVLKHPTEPNLYLLRRVIALEGDKIEIKNNRLIINDVELGYQEQGSDPNFFRETLNQAEQYLVQLEDADSVRAQFGPFVVPAGQMFILNDNRKIKEDSRLWGSVSTNLVEAKAEFIWLSTDVEARLSKNPMKKIRWDRMLRKVN